MHNTAPDQQYVKVSPSLEGSAMRRREFITIVGSAAASWPLAAYAQQPAIPVVGFINAASAQNYTRQLRAFLKGLGEAGLVDGQNMKIEYRWAEGQNDRLPAMAADLVNRRVAVIAATSTPAALAAKAATTTIPIVFELGADPVELGLVASLSRPAGNVTGVFQWNIEVAPKRLELLHELLPTARVMALLVDPTDPTNAKTTVSEVTAAAKTFGLQLHVLNASNENDFTGVFAKLIQLGAGGLVVGGGAFFVSHEKQLAALTVRHAVPAAFRAPRVRCSRRFVELRNGHYRRIPSNWHLYRPDSQGRPTRRAAGTAGNKG